MVGDNNRELTESERRVRAVIIVLLPIVPIVMLTSIFAARAYNEGSSVLPAAITGAVLAVGLVALAILFSSSNNDDVDDERQCRD